jgi:hypothetical protein
MAASAVQSVFYRIWRSCTYSYYIYTHVIYESVGRVILLYIIIMYALAGAALARWNVLISAILYYLGVGDGRRGRVLGVVAGRRRGYIPRHMILLLLLLLLYKNAFRPSAFFFIVVKYNMYIRHSKSSSFYIHTHYLGILLSAVRLVCRGWYDPAAAINLKRNIILL